MAFSRLLRFFSDHLSITSSNSSAPEKEESSSNSSAPKKEESSSNSSAPKIMVSTSTSSIALLGVMLMASSTFIYYFYSKASSSNSSALKQEESSSSSSEPKQEESSSNSSEPKQEESSSAQKKEESSSNSSEPKNEESSSNLSAQKKKNRLLIHLNQKKKNRLLITHLHKKTKKKESSSNSSEPKKEESSSTPTSSIQKRFKYDVFISFRGEDTRKNFVDHLYHALKDKGIYVYKDDEKIQKGKRISDDLFQSIEDSKFYIIVFSKNYASSSWCLEELAQIMECQKMSEHTAYPVFYDVEPTEVRKQSGVVGKAFAKHENEKAAVKWKGALKEAADLAGWELKNTFDGHEAKFINKIVHEISLELHSIDFGFDEKLVGMETRVKDVVSSLEDGADEVRMIGIKGMGGVGKTTTARAVFDHLSADFESKSFVKNVREASRSSDGLKNLQEKVLSKVLNEQVTLDSVDDGKKKMKRRMFGKKVLLVLDDVDQLDQLEALAGDRKWFRPGSIILITTRDEQLLEAHRVKICDIAFLSQQEAICLFSRYAFGTQKPAQGYKELSGKVVSYAAGLPLTLKVLGSFLCNKDKLDWVDAIDRLEKIPLHETLKQLELSYISLEDDYQEIFQDIACILKGQTKEDAIRILECCGFHARIGLKVLEQRSLITISEDGYLGMHDHIEEMGKNIVRRKHKKPEKHSHLWIKEEIGDILTRDKGTKATRCLKVDMSRGNPRILMKGLGKMKNLQYLEMNFAYFKRFRGEDFVSDAECLDDTSCQYFSNSLKYLKCGHYPFLYLPKTFQANNLVGLEMYNSRMVQLWEEGDIKVLEKLKFLSLSSSNLATFDFKIAPYLETLSLYSSCNLVELCMPVTCQKLKHLVISDSKLINFDLGLTPNLERLTLDNCADFEELHMYVACPNLKYLDISHSKLITFDLRLTPNLERLTLDKCADFEELHVSVACPNLKFLSLCETRLRSLDLELIPNLERLDLKGCDKLVEINAPVGCLKNVVHLNLSGCLRFTEFVCHGGSEPKVSHSSASLDLGVESLDSCPLHPNSNLPKLRFRCDYDENLQSSVGNIEKLISFGLCTCTDFKKISDTICSLQCLKRLTLQGYIPEFPKDIGQLECLEELRLYSQKIKHLPNNICMLKHLRYLYLGSFSLERLPEDLDRLECLERLDIRYTGISHLPQSIFGLKGLLIAASPKLLQLYRFPSEIETTTSSLWLDARVEDVVSSLEMGIDEVRMIGIKGMGGVGKTYTARAVFDRLFNHFKAKSFVGNVGEVSKSSGLKKLQEKVLSKVLNEHVTLDSVDDGKDMMKKRMCSKKVLLVLDDVDHIDQLEALAEPNWFKPGSRIIITTRDAQVLVAHGVKVIRDIALLSEQEAICFFSRYAFGTENPVQGYEELSGEVVRYAACLPLTLKVLGSFLYEKDKDEWVDAIERLKNIPFVG